MQIRKSFYFKPRIFAAGELKRSMESILTSVFSPGNEISVTLIRDLPDGTKKSEHDLTVDALDTICDLIKEPVYIKLFFGQKEKYYKKEMEVALSDDLDGSISIDVEANSIDLVHAFTEAFIKELGLERALSPKERVKQTIEKMREEQKEEGHKTIPEQIKELCIRVETLEAQLTINRPISCFLSYQFSEPSLEYGRQVKHFLELHGIKVVTGQGYEPKPISEKVRSRLSEGLNMVVVIEVNDRKSPWTRDEMARAQSPGVFLIPLVEEGATLIEVYMVIMNSFHLTKVSISDAFVGLLEGVNYVRRAVGSKTDNSNAPA